jgi:hypothetical protein
MDGQDLTQRLGAMLLGRFARNNPLAASVRLVLEQIVVPAQLNALFDQHSERQYTRKILFSSIVQVMLAVVSGRVDAPLAAMKRQGDALKASFSAFYEKIAGTETAVSSALVAHSFAQGRALLVEMGGLRQEPLPGWRLRILDGNRIAASERRLQPLWGVVAGPLPGLALVAFDVAAMMMSDVILCEDGHASERSLVAQILALVVKGDCWIADRNFCTYDILFGVMEREATFVIRHHAGMVGEPVGPRRALGRCATGRLFEQSYKLRHGEETRTVRRVTVALDKPTRDDETELHILSSLPPEVSAETIASLYNSRWTIEKCHAWNTSSREVYHLDEHHEVCSAALVARVAGVKLLLGEGVGEGGRCEATRRTPTSREGRPWCEAIVCAVPIEARAAARPPQRPPTAATPRWGSRSAPCAPSPSPFAPSCAA